MTEFRPGQSANEAHAALKSAVQTMEKAQQCAVLWFGEILERKLYLQLGYGSINQYAKLELGFSTSRTGDFLQLCRKLEAVEKAVGQPSLLPTLPASRPAAVVPVRVGLEMSPTQFARYEVLWEQIRKQGNAPADKVEALLEIMAYFVAESSPRGELSTPAKPPVQIHIHKCPECDQATGQTGKGELEIGETELERAQCDCQVSRPGQKFITGSRGRRAEQTTRPT